MGRNDRPEHAAPPEIFYNDDEARKYTDNSRMITIQTKLTERALELLALPDDGPKARPSRNGRPQRPPPHSLAARTAHASSALSPDARAAARPRSCSWTWAAAPA